MKLSVFELEKREVPFAGIWSHDGHVFVTSEQGQQFDFTPFQDFNAAQNTAAWHSKYLVTGANTGGGPRVQIRIIEPIGNDSRILSDFFAYEPNFLGGVKVAIGDLNNDGIPEIITSPDNGGGPVVKVWSINGDNIGAFLAYPSDFRGGCGIAVDEKNQSILVSPGVGGGPILSIFDGLNFNCKSTRFFKDSSDRMGHNLIYGDVTSDGIDDIVYIPTDNKSSILIDDQLGYSPIYVDAPDKTNNYYVGLSRYSHLDSGLNWGVYGSAKIYDTIPWTQNNTVVLTENFASGNPTPPVTTGWKTGNWIISKGLSRYERILNGEIYTNNLSSDEYEVLSGYETLITKDKTVYAGGSVGKYDGGTGTVLGIVERNGIKYVLTAKHVVSSNSFINENIEQISPGTADGGIYPKDLIGTSIEFSVIRPENTGILNEVDVALISVNNNIELKSEYVINGFKFRVGEPINQEDLTIGDKLFSMSRGILSNSGLYVGKQNNPVRINYGNNNYAAFNNQLVGIGIVENLSYPGFSGGPVFVAKRDNLGYTIHLIGMTIAGGGQGTLITPWQKIKETFNITYNYS